MKEESEGKEDLEGGYLFEKRRSGQKCLETAVPLRPVCGQTHNKV